MNRKIILCVLSLALVFASAGVCFADVSTTIPTMTVGESEPVFSQSLTNGDLVIFQYDETILPRNEVKLLFNNVYCKATYSGGNSTFWLSTDDTFNSCVYVNAEHTSSGFQIYLKFDGTSNSSELRMWYAPNNNFSSWNRYNNYYLTRSLISPSITYGDVIAWTDNSIIGEVLDFSIPAGYAFVIDGHCDILERSYYINNSWNFRDIDNYRVNGAIERVLGSTSIRDGFSPDRLRPSSDLIHWEAMNSNIFGTASTYEFYDGVSVSVGAGESYVISYPTLYGYGNSNSVILMTNAVDMVCQLYIQYSTRPTFRWVAIESLSEYSNSGSFSTYSVFRPDLVDEDSSSSSGSGGTIITPENNLPSNGGNHGQPSVNDDSSLLGVFSRLTNLITNLFKDAIDAVQSIISAGSSFVEMVSAMFGWLPPELLGVLTSALIVIVVIGVVKALL